MLGERGLRGHEDGGLPTKHAIEALLPGAVATMSPDSIVVELHGVPQSKLVSKSVPAGIAMLVLEGGREIDVFAREVTMSHGLTIGMTRAAAKARQPTLTCVTSLGSTTCTLPGSRFSFRMHEDTIDHVLYIRE